MDFRQEVRQLYLRLLGREADPEGLEYWSGLAAQCGNLDPVRKGIEISREHRSKFANIDAPNPHDRSLYPGYSSSDLALFASFWKRAAKAERGFVVDFLGGRVRTSSLWTGARSLDGQVLGPPVPADYHAEAAEWVGLLKSVRSARGQYVAMELGAGFGPWIVAGGNAARSKGIKAIRLYGVEADPQHFTLLRQNLADNGFDPDKHILIEAAVGVASGTARWPVLKDSLDDWGSRPISAEADTASDYLGRSFQKTMAINVISMTDLVKKESLWDLIHIDVQGHEVDICRSCIEELSGRARWIVVGTHSRKLEGDMLELMYTAGWVLENEKPCRFNFSCEAASLEAMTFADGIQVWRNPRLLPKN